MKNFYTIDKENNTITWAIPKEAIGNVTLGVRSTLFNPQIIPYLLKTVEEAVWFVLDEKS